MGEAIQCDRCDGFESRGTLIDDMKIKFGLTALPNSAYLCRSCQKAFREWWYDGDGGGDGA